MILGVLNLTPDSFSDGGRYLETAAAVSHAMRMRTDGADVIDVGAAASNVASPAISPEQEIARLEPVLDQLLVMGGAVSVDSASSVVQRYALARGVDYLNDVSGFGDPALYERLAAASAKLIVMHSMTGARAVPRDTAPDAANESILRFFDRRIEALRTAGVSDDRLILDPGMGLFLGRGAGPSLEVLRGLQQFRRRFGLPVLVCVSRKSFLGEITGRGVTERGAATLVAELYAIEQGADYVRTHDPGALRDALAIRRALRD